jgi:hypothetical protein
VGIEELMAGYAAYTTPEAALAEIATGDQAVTPVSISVPVSISICSATYWTIYPVQ